MNAGRVSPVFSIIPVQRRAVSDLFFPVSQDFVIRKLSSIYPITFTNFFMGNAIVRISVGTQSRADGSNMPRTTLGSSFSCSGHGYFRIRQATIRVFPARSKRGLIVPFF
jgi:hypothetical protein